MSAQKNAWGSGIEEEEATISSCPACTARMIHRNALGLEGLEEYLSNDVNDTELSISLPHFEEKSISVRRLSAYPDLDQIRRVNSVSSVMGEAAGEGSGDRRASVGTLVVTDMGAGHVGVERRLSGIAACLNEVNGVNGVPSGVTESEILASRPSSSLLNSSPATVADINLPPHDCQGSQDSAPISPRTPQKAKDRPDSIDLAIARSPTLVTHSRARPDTRDVPSDKPPAGHPFAEWAGFPPSSKSKPSEVVKPPHTPVPTLQEKKKIGCRLAVPSSQGSVRKRRLTLLADTVAEQKRLSMDEGDTETPQTPQ